MTRYTQASALLIFLAISSCTKTSPPALGDTTIAGRIIDSITKEPIVGMPVDVWYIDAEAGVGLNFSHHRVGTATTNSKGNYQLDFSARNYSSAADFYRIENEFPGSHFPFTTQIFCSEADYHSTSVDFDLVKKISIKIKVRNTAPVNPDDYFRLQTFGQTPQPSQLYSWNGSLMEETVSQDVALGQPTIFEYSIKRDGIYYPEQRDTVVFTTAGEMHSIAF